MRKGLSPELSNSASAGSSSRKEGRFSWMRLANFRQKLRSLFCACCKKENLNGWAAQILFLAARAEERSEFLAEVRQSHPGKSSLLPRARTGRCAVGELR